MTAPLWQGVVNAVLYSIQFDRIDPGTVEKVVNTLTTRPSFNLTPEDQYHALNEALGAGDPLTSAIPTNHNEEDFRAFLAAVVERMDAVRPWPEPPFRQIEESRFHDLSRAPAIAAIHLPVLVLGGAVGARFVRSHDYDQDFLLLHLRSGSEIGFIWPYWRDSDAVVVTTTDTTKPPSEILEELVACTRLEPGQVIPIEPIQTSQIQIQPNEYDTTPIQPEFFGENLPGNRVWNGSQRPTIRHHWSTYSLDPARWPCNLRHGCFRHFVLITTSRPRQISSLELPRWHTSGRSRRDSRNPRRGSSDTRSQQPLPSRTPIHPSGDRQSSPTRCSYRREPGRVPLRDAVASGARAAEAARSKRPSGGWSGRAEALLTTLARRGWPRKARNPRGPARVSVLVGS